MSEPLWIPLPEEAGGGQTDGWLDRAPDVAAKGAAARDLLVLAHGAGGHAEHATVVDLAAALAAAGFDVLRFDFTYRRRGADGERARRPPDRMPQLVACFGAVAAAAREQLAPARLFVGGHSMGGRAAAHWSLEAAAPPDGLVLCAYPLHPPKRPERLRDAVLLDVDARGCPLLWASGTRDGFLTPEADRTLRARLSAHATHLRIEGADHGYAVPKRSGRTRADALQELTEAARTWRTSLRAPRRRKA